MSDNTIDVKIGKRVFQGQVIGFKNKFLTVAVSLPIVGADAMITHTFEVSRETVEHCKRENTPVLVR